MRPAGKSRSGSSDKLYQLRASNLTGAQEVTNGRVAEMLGVLLGLACALLWGSGDFTGGLATRRNHALQVLVVASVSGLLMLTVFALLAQEGLPSSKSAGWAAAAGLFGTLAIAALYRGLATGHAAEVAPVAAVIGTAIPVAIGSWLHGWPALAQIVGLGIVFPAVWLVSRSRAARDMGPSDGLGFAWLAGIGIGGFLVFMAQIEVGPVFAPLVVARVVAVCAGVFLLAVVGVHPLRLHRPAVACLAGCLDAGGNVLYVLASRYARLDVAAALASMAPAATVGLACWLTSQKVTRTQLLGVAFCLVAAVLLAA